MIYLDYAAATPVEKRVLEKMRPYFTKLFANPSSGHDFGKGVRKAVEEARRRVAKCLGVESSEIIFTSSGTASINLALVGVCRTLRLQGKGSHIVTTKVEHKAVLETCRYLEKEGFAVTYLDVDKSGLVTKRAVMAALRHGTIMVSIMYANNEVGTVEPVAEIAHVVRKRGILLHTDTCQAGNVLDIRIKRLGVDLLSLNASKIYGPKGVGVLYVRSGVLLDPLIHGGGQERGIVSGTENVAGIVGCSYALEFAQKKYKQEAERLGTLRNYLRTEIKKEISDVKVLGHPLKVLPSILTVAFRGVEAEAILQYLSCKKIYVSTGSACSSLEVEVSSVLDAMNVADDYIKGAIRFSLGKMTTRKDLVRVVRELRIIVAALRQI